MITAARSSTKGEILVVEDTPASLQLLGDLLTHGGYTVRCAQDGFMALRSAQSRAPDLILLDIRMPNIDGYEVCRHLKADLRTCDVPVIFLSALHETDDKIQAFRLGAVDYIAKPYQPDEVLARVGTHIELHRLQTGLEALVQERTAQYQEAERNLRESQARLRELADFLQKIREKERTRIARELHDELGQSLTALRIDLSWLNGRCDNSEAKDRLESSLGLLDRTMESVRRISNDLRPSMLDDLGLAAAVESHIDGFAQRSGISCNLAMNCEEFDIDSEIATVLYRVVQEALTNVYRHAQAKHVKIQIDDMGASIHLLVTDDGLGFSRIPAGKHFGLMGIRERIGMVGGRIEIRSEPDVGTTIEATVPKAGERIDD